MSSDQPQFDDPPLKAAVQRAMAGEHAPAGLRGRIEALMVGEHAPNGSRPAARARVGRWAWLGPRPALTALAASVAIVALGVMFYQVKTNFFPSTPASTYVKRELPETFAMEMVTAHTNCAKLPDHHLIAGNDFAKLKETLEAQLKIPVAAMELTGWTFKGAGICKVGQLPSAHLVYANARGQVVSVFCLRADAVYAAPEGATYTQMADGHPLSGFKQGQGLYCVVGPAGPDAPTTNEVEQLRDRLHAALPQVGCEFERPGTGAGALSRT